MLVKKINARVEENLAASSSFFLTLELSSIIQFYHNKQLYCRLYHRYYVKAC